MEINKENCSRALMALDQVARDYEVTSEPYTTEYTKYLKEFIESVRDQLPKE